MWIAIYKCFDQYVLETNILDMIQEKNISFLKTILILNSDLLKINWLVHSMKRKRDIKQTVAGHYGCLPACQVTIWDTSQSHVLFTWSCHTQDVFSNGNHWCVYSKPSPPPSIGTDIIQHPLSIYIQYTDKAGLHH